MAYQHAPSPQTKRNESGSVGADIKKGTYVYQPLATIDVPKVTQLMQLLDGMSLELRLTFQL